MNETSDISIFDIIAVLITLSALFSYINHRYIRLPTTIGLMLIALLMSLGIVALDAMDLSMGLAAKIKLLMDNIDFNATLMQGMLSFLLFAGALHVNINDLAKNKWIIGFLATIGICLSTLIIAFVCQWVLAKINIDLPFIYCLLFGALISPTDPIAVIGILKSAGAPKSLETKISGESLFNDGVGVVIFVVLLGIATGDQEFSASSIALLFAQEVIGGLIFGLLIGAIAYYLLKSIDNYQVEILITLAVVCGGYSLAHSLHLSGPIAVVIAGLLIGNQGRLLAMSDKTREHLDMFWELIDEILNALLFVMIGLEVLVLTFNLHYLTAGLFMIPVVLMARLISVAIPVTLLRMRHEFSRHAIRIMTWGGLRGGISVALALSLPTGEERDLILVITYIIVVFSILVQGLTIGPLIRATDRRKK